MTSSCFFLFGKMTVFDKPPLSFVDFRLLTDLGELQGGTGRCSAEIFSEFPDDGGCSDVAGVVAW